jgi:MFS family permease
MISHGMTLVQVSVALALLAGVPGAIGTYFSGVIADRYGSRDVRWYVYVPLIATLISILFAPIFYLTGSTAIALAAAVVPVMMGATYVGPAFAMTQALVPLRMRAQAIAILLFVLNIIGLGLGPLTVGYVSEILKPTFGTDSLRYALLFGSAVGLVGGFCYWMASRPLKKELELAKADQERLSS